MVREANGVKNELRGNRHRTSSYQHRRKAFFEVIISGERLKSPRRIKPTVHVERNFGVPNHAVAHLASL